MEGEFPIVPATPSTSYFNRKEEGEARRSFLYYCMGRPEEGLSQMAAEVKLRLNLSELQLVGASLVLSVN